MFQQGNQRVVLTLELAPFIRGAIPDECDDVRTIGVLASDMMLGRITRPGEPALTATDYEYVLPGRKRDDQLAMARRQRA